MSSLELREVSKTYRIRGRGGRLTAVDKVSFTLSAGKTLALPAKGLPKGTYVARLTATDGAGNRSGITKVTFRVR